MLDLFPIRSRVFGRALISGRRPRATGELDRLCSKRRGQIQVEHVVPASTTVLVPAETSTSASDDDDHQPQHRRWDGYPAAVEAALYVWTSKPAPCRSGIGCSRAPQSSPHLARSLFLPDRVEGVDGLQTRGRSVSDSRARRSAYPSRKAAGGCTSANAGPR
jgi:hypothetical protein